MEKLRRGRHGLPAKVVAAHQRRRLIDAAAAAFAERRFRLSSRWIASRAGVSSSAFYEHFDGVDAVLTAAFDAVAEDLHDRIDGSCEQNGPAAATAELCVEEPAAAALLGLGAAAGVTEIARRRAELVERLAASLQGQSARHAVAGAIAVLVESDAPGELAPQVAALLVRWGCG